ncbi:hypothetical protein ACFS5L_22850 [Streptomyces phyllanthi]|uniref:Transcriptional regulator SbtR-like C-terminal domain-containing protein n=1 Tax=Streptomyces phyllanthi TaxID=1803180 RepID=A0A5N8W4P7_9ACTN|nr:hypothetical protein [Streptomyces phyllanthi]MPY41866.1 hypothetical protein [Streptomyces phyllanthi]
MTEAGYAAAVLAPEAEKRFRNTFGDLLARAQAVGAVRGGLAVDDVRALLVGCMAMQRYRGEAGGLGPRGEIVQDGLRAAGADGRRLLLGGRSSRTRRLIASQALQHGP